VRVHQRSGSGSKVGEVLAASGRRRGCDSVQLDEVILETSLSASIASSTRMEGRLELYGAAVMLRSSTSMSIRYV
jgi:hypothetical protein